MLRLITASLLIMAAVMIGRHSNGQELPFGQPIPYKGLFCDTEDQIASILKTHQDKGYQAGRDKYVEYLLQKNDQNEPSCADSRQVVMLVPEEVITVVENLDFGGTPRDCAIVRVHSLANTTYYALFFRKRTGVGI